jgi:hypothetical protein
MQTNCAADQERPTRSVLEPGTWRLYKGLHHRLRRLCCRGLRRCTLHGFGIRRCGRRRPRRRSNSRGCLPLDLLAQLWHQLASSDCKLAGRLRAQVRFVRAQRTLKVAHRPLRLRERE